MQQLQYRAPNLIYVFQKLIGGDTPNPFWHWDPESAPSPVKSWLRAWWEGVLVNGRIRELGGRGRGFKLSKGRANPSMSKEDRNGTSSR